MPQVFNYRARNLSGRLVCGKVECDSPGGVADLLRKSNCFAVEIRPARSAGPRINKFFSFNIDIKSMSVFCRQFSAMLEAGIPLLQCLNILTVQTENKLLTRILRETITSVEKGKSLSDAFRVHQDCLPEIFINMIASGEVSGTLGQVVTRLTTHFEKEHRSREKIKSAMTYPLLVAGMVFFSVVSLMVFVVPVFAGMFEAMGAELPLPTRIVIGLSSALASYWYLFLLSCASLFLILKRISMQKSSNIVLNSFLLTVPVLGKMARQIIVARFITTV